MVERRKLVIEAHVPGTTEGYAPVTDADRPLVSYYGSASGSTSEADIVSAFDIPKGFSYVLKELVVAAEQATWVYINYSTDGGSTWSKVASVYLPSPGTLVVDFRHGIKLDGGDNVKCKVTYKQSTAGVAEVTVTFKKVEQVS